MRQKSTALVNFGAACTPEVGDDHLKLCFLWYDEILIEPLKRDDGGYIHSELLNPPELKASERNAYHDIVASLDDRVSQDLLCEYREARDATVGYPRWPNDLNKYTYPEPENAEEHAHNVLLAHFEKEQGVEPFGLGALKEQAEGRAQEEKPEGQSDLHLFWVFQRTGGAQIERHVLNLPLSRDQQRLEELQKSLASYRMVFGQPRQDDLLAYLMERIPETDLESLAHELRVNLEPPKGGPESEATSGEYERGSTPAGGADR